METKLCSKCGVEKALSDFSKNKNKRDGLKTSCKDCARAYRAANKEKIREREKAYRQANKAIISERGKVYHEANKEKIAEKMKAYREANKEKMKAYREANKEKIAEQMKVYYEANKASNKACRKTYYEANKEKIKAYQEANKEKIRERQKANRKMRRATDPHYRVMRNVSTLVSRALKKQGTTKGGSTFSALPYTPLDLVEHLEKQFDETMTWDNYGSYWDVDHIHPQSLLPYDSLEHPNFQKCWALDNLQPLEHLANIRKSNKILDD
tara:strand:- start:79 stop:882 length:804 start_codon:yes stop_codon:yes gene_type:complete